MGGRWGRGAWTGLAVLVVAVGLLPGLACSSSSSASLPANPDVTAQTRAWYDGQGGVALRRLGTTLVAVEQPGRPVDAAACEDVATAVGMVQHALPIPDPLMDASLARQLDEMAGTAGACLRLAQQATPPTIEQVAAMAASFEGGWSQVVGAVSMGGVPLNQTTGAPG